MTEIAKKGRGRAKKVPPTKEESMKLLEEAIQEVKNIITELKQEQEKVQPLGLKRVPELLQATLKNLDEDLAQFQDKYDELTKQA